jgi:hypothetical protein
MTTLTRHSLAGFSIGILLSIPVLMLAVFCAGAGHGTYTPAKLLLPFAMIFVVGRESITPAIVGVALIQFPIYGLICGALYCSRYFRYYAIGLAIIHSVLAIIVILQRDQGFA